MAENSNNVDQIRELIFGSQIKEFEARFAQIEKNIAESGRDLAKKIDEITTKLKKENDRALEVLEKKIDNLALSTQKERTKLREMIDTTEEALQSQLASQKEEMETKLKVFKESVGDEHDKIAQMMATMRKELENAIREGLDKLDDAKLSRDAMAHLLVDVAMRIQGTDAAAVMNEGGKSENTKR